MPVLSLRDNKFVLTDGSVQKTFSSMKNALHYRHHADRTVTDLFDQVLNRSYPLPIAPLPKCLDPHQVEGVKWILSRSRSYLAHAPGAGKTWQAVIGALWAEGVGQSLFVVPPSLTMNWARETYRIFEIVSDYDWEWPSVSVIPLSKNQEFAGWGASIVIMPDSLLTRDWALDRLIAMRKKIVAVDEASRFKESASDRTKALFGGKLKSGRVVPGLVRDAKHAVLLDGSPAPARAMDLWAPTYGMCPETIDFYTQEQFGMRYCGPTINSYGRYEFKRSSNEAELQRRLRTDFMHVVREEDLSHPERRRSLLIMSEDVRSHEQKNWERKNLGGLKLSEISDENAKGELARFRRELGERKIDWVARYVKDRLATLREAILLFAWHRSVCEGLARALVAFNPGLVMGGTSQEEREHVFGDFQAARRHIIIGNIGAMGRGNNLQRADRVIFAEFAWNDETNRQAEKRASRKGRSAALPVRCDYCVCPGSMDEPILNAIFRKETMGRKLFG